MLQQDNTSSIKLEANGKRSSTKRTRHINIRYFYITDKIKLGDVVVVYHSTGKMVRDFLTKSLNGSPFKNHRNAIMGLNENTIEYYEKKKKMLRSNIENVLRVKEREHPNRS